MPAKKSSSSSKRPSKKTTPEAPKSSRAKKAPKKAAKKAPAKPAKKKLAKQDIGELQTLRRILKHSHQHDSIGHAVNVMQENLNSYILLGYSFNGEPITAVSASTPQEYDALYSRAVQFVQQQSNPKLGGEPPAEE